MLRRLFRFHNIFAGDRSVKAALRNARRLIFLALLLLALAYAQAVPAQEPELDFLLLEVRLDQTVLSSSIPAYDLGPHTLLPLGELARLLSIAIQTQPSAGTASGFILNEDRGFSLSLENARVTRAGVTERFDPALVLVEPDDLYVALSLLQQWLPVELDVDHSNLVLRVHPLEVLPLQARLKRASLSGMAGTRDGYKDPGYPHAPLPYRLWSPPVVDHSLTVQYRENDDLTQLDGRYTAHITGDLLGLESSIYFSKNTRGSSEEIRATLGRHDPEGGLLGPLHARSYLFGSLSSTAVENVLQGTTGHGISVSNRPLTRPTQFDLQTFEGDLTAGWDVELFYNGALVGLQQSNPDGRYRFEDQPLSYGRNDFKLVFHGPLGQTRVEQHSYSLAESMVQPGEFQYHLLEHRDEGGLPRSVVQFDLGLARSLSVAAGFVSAPVAGLEHQYATAGLRTFWQTLSLSADMVKDQGGGSLAQVGLKTRFSGIALDASRIYLDGFHSDIFPSFSDPILTRDKLRLNGAIKINARANLPLAIEASWDERESGRVDTDLRARISTYAYRTALTNTLNWRSVYGVEEAYGSLQVSRRIRDLSVRGEMQYSLGSEASISALALSADKFLANGYRLSLAVAHRLHTPETRYSAGFSKSLGRFGLGANASYSNRGEVAANLQFFLSLGRDALASGWRLDARPKANVGAASVRMFLDENNNGMMDLGEHPLPGVGFTVNGGRHQARTDAAGIAHIDHLPIKQRVDIGVDLGTLEDPQWAPEVAGRSFVPRPGRVAELDLPVRLTTEIDGTVYLLEEGAARGMGGVKLQLLNERSQVIAETTSSWDGFYIIDGMVAGKYFLRASPEQLQPLGLKNMDIRALTIAGDGTFIHGADLLVGPRELDKSPIPESAWGK